MWMKRAPLWLLWKLYFATRGLKRRSAKSNVPDFAHYRKQFLNEPSAQNGPPMFLDTPTVTNTPQWYQHTPYISNSPHCNHSARFTANLHTNRSTLRVDPTLKIGLLLVRYGETKISSVCQRQASLRFKGAPERKMAYRSEGSTGFYFVTLEQIICKLRFYCSQCCTNIIYRQKTTLGSHSKSESKISHCKVLYHIARNLR